MDREDESFFAAPGEVGDWRRALVYDAAARAGVLVALPASPEAISHDLGLDRDAVRVVLDALAVWAVVSPAEDGTYETGPQMPGVEDGAVLRHHARAVRNWSRSIDDRLRGADHRLTVPPAGATAADRMDPLAVFARRWGPDLVDACLGRFPDATTALDLGGGHGEYALEMARRGLRVTLQDRPEVIASAQADGRLAQAGVERFGGDFFEQLPGGSFDLVLLANVAHTLDGPGNLSLYRRVLPLINPGGGLAILAFVRGRDPRSAIFALQMLAGGGGGDAHAEDDYSRWLDQAGFSGFQVQDLADQPQSLVLADKSASSVVEMA